MNAVSDSSRSLDSQRTMRGDAPAPVRRLRAGDVLLSRYTVLSELGEGGMGVVYKCMDQVGGIEVAVKCLPPELSRNEGEMEGIRENYGIVAKLHHSAISGLRNLEKDPATGEYYLVMDLAEGEDLSAILRRRRGRPMPLEEALAILRPLASALDYAHGERVLHRDVKPANVKVLVTGESDPATIGPCDHATTVRVQLLDFGLAAEVRSSMSRVSVRGHGGTSGTPAYMAPEQWEAQYALAVVAYQMLAGFLPFDSEDTDLLRRAVLSRDPDPIPGLPREANAALLRALAKDPAARFPSCTAFVEAVAHGEKGSFGEFAESVSRAEGAENAEDVSHAVFAKDSESPGLPLPPHEGNRKRVSEDAVHLPKELPLSFSLFARKRKNAIIRRRRNNWIVLVAMGLFLSMILLCLVLGGRLSSMSDSEFRSDPDSDAGPFVPEVLPEPMPGARRMIRIGSVEVAFRWCPPGSFLMGSPETEEGRCTNETQHLVTITRGFWMGETEVTQGLWKEVMGTNPSHFQSGDDCPVENVSWDDCQTFLLALDKWAPSGFCFALPREDQWEYACRAGSSTAFFWGSALNGAKANCNGNYPYGTTTKGPYRGTTTRVGSYDANPWGLFDMHGNVMEWCANGYDAYPTCDSTDLEWPKKDSNRVLRGGSWNYAAEVCRSACRVWCKPNLKFNRFGLRMALVPKESAIK